MEIEDDLIKALRQIKDDFDLFVGAGYDQGSVEILIIAVYFDFRADRNGAFCIIGAVNNDSCLAVFRLDIHDPGRYIFPVKNSFIPGSTGNLNILNASGFLGAKKRKSR